MTANHRPLESSDIELIDCVRATPCLYDSKDPNFRLVFKKDEEWQNIAEGLNIAPWDVRKRWTVLRDRYARELKQLILHPESTEYGKNDFFLRMDFLRDFVKKREVKRKRCNSRGMTIKSELRPTPLKLFKVDCDESTYGSDDYTVSDHEKSYISHDSQYCSSEKFSYVEQLSQDPIVQEEQHEDVNLSQQCGHPEYHDYVEGTSGAYESVEEHNETSTHDDSTINISGSSPKNVETVTIKPENTKVPDNFSITAIEEEISPLPQLQQRPIIVDVCSEAASSSLQIDTEEYFSKTIASYLRELSPRYKIKAKIEMMQIIEKFLGLEESNS